MRIRWSWLALAATLTATLGAQQPSPSPSPATRPRKVQTFGVETSRVLLDVVVRDKKDNPVRDLEAKDFTVYEDGALQRVDMFEVVGSRSAPSREEPPAPAKPSPTPSATPPAPSGPPVIAFVFDRLSPEGRQKARDSSLTYLDGVRQPEDRVGVFLIDLSLVTVQRYTKDPELIRKALEAAAARSTSQYASSRDRQRDISAKAEGLLQTAGGATSGGGAGGAAGNAASGAAAGVAAMEAQLLAMEQSMARNFESLERDQQGYATTNGLLAVVSSLKALPGRKSVVFFCEGLSIPVAVQSHFRSVISEANRANVSVYAVDPGGLRVESPVAETRREMLTQANEQVRRGGSSGSYVGGPMSKQLERNEDLLRLNPHSGLGQLASDTGGFLVKDTNDMRSGFRRINEDLRFHYVLAYEPTNPALDGRYRQIDVKVARPGVEVRARKGYYAVPRTEGRPLLPYEVQAQARLQQGPTPDAFPARLRGFSFPEPGKPGLVPIVMQVPGNVLKFTTEAKTKTYRGHLVVLATIKDELGDVVDRLSQSYELQGPQEKLAAARGGEVLFYREAQLLPGRYTVEAIAYDELAAAGTVRSTSLEVPDSSADHVYLASVVQVNRVEALPESDAQAAGPFTFGKTLIYPSLGEAVRKSKAPEVFFFVTAYSAKKGRTSATLQVLRDGTKLAEAPMALPDPDASGRIQHVFGLPLAGFAPGSYELHVAVADSRGRDARSATFEVAE